MANMGSAPEFRASTGRSAGSESIIDEHHSMANKTVITNAYQFAYERVGLDSRTGTDGNIFLYLDEGSNEASIPDPAAIEVYRHHDLDPFTKDDILDAAFQQQGLLTSHFAPLTGNVLV
jgi:hypothetical protein